MPARFRAGRSLAVVAAMLGTFGCAGSAVTVPRAPGPRIVVSPESRDLGVVPLGEDAVAEFEVRNEGGSPLTLAAPALPRATSVEGLVPELAPGKSVTLRYRIDTLNANAESRQDWTLATNDPDHPTVTMGVRLDVRPFLMVRPGQARFITVQSAREGTLAQTIGAADGSTFRVLRVEAPAPFLRVSFREALSVERQAGWNGSQWRVEITLLTDAPVGPLTGMVVVHTDHPRQKRAFVLLSGFVRPMLAATPPEAPLGELDRRRTTPLHLLLKNFAEELVDVTGVSTDVPAVRAEIEPIERGRTWRVKLFAVPDAPLGPFSGKVLVHTASPKVPTFAVPLSGQLVESAGAK